MRTRLIVAALALVFLAATVSGWRAITFHARAFRIQISASAVWRLILSHLKASASERRIPCKPITIRNRRCAPSVWPIRASIVPGDGRRSSGLGTGSVLIRRSAHQSLSAA